MTPPDRAPSNSAKPDSAKVSQDALQRVREKVKKCLNGAKDDARLETLPGYDRTHYGRILAFQTVLNLIDAESTKTEASDGALGGREG